jgi:hypothetical protein
MESLQDCSLSIYQLSQDSVPFDANGLLSIRWVDIRISGGGLRNGEQFKKRKNG